LTWTLFGDKRPLSSNKQHLKNGVCLEVWREDCQNYFPASCGVRQLCTMLVYYSFLQLTD